MFTFRSKNLEKGRRYGTTPNAKAERFRGGTLFFALDFASLQKTICEFDGTESETVQKRERPSESRAQLPLTYFHDDGAQNK